jgi:hypothetical protein
MRSLGIIRGLALGAAVCLPVMAVAAAGAPVEPGDMKSGIEGLASPGEPTFLSEQLRYQYGGPDFAASSRDQCNGGVGRTRDCYRYVPVVPEPSSAILTGCGIVAVLALRRALARRSAARRADERGA